MHRESEEGVYVIQISKAAFDYVVRLGGLFGQSPPHVVRYAMATYDAVGTAMLRGDKVIIRRRNGSETTIEFLEVLFCEKEVALQRPRRRRLRGRLKDWVLGRRR